MSLFHKYKKSTQRTSSGYTNWDTWSVGVIRKSRKTVFILSCICLSDNGQTRSKNFSENRNNNLVIEHLWYDLHVFILIILMSLLSDGFDVAFPTFDFETLL